MAYNAYEQDKDRADFEALLNRNKWGKVGRFSGAMPSLPANRVSGGIVDQPERRSTIENVGLLFDQERFIETYIHEASKLLLNQVKKG
jgi:hypothetical protein